MEQCGVKHSLGITKDSQSEDSEFKTQSWVWADYSAHRPQPSLLPKIKLLECEVQCF
jgi:hypothetical protein